jgi:hypothetical protein
MDKNSSATVPIVVATIGVVGTITTALIANWDKIFAERPATAVTAPQQQQQPAGAGPQAVAEVPERGKSAAVSARAGRNPAATDEDEAEAEQSANVGPSSDVDISGLWSDAGGFFYRIEQRGSAYAYQQFQNGALVGTGAGQIHGRRMEHEFVAPGMAGECRGEVSSDGGQIAGTCSRGPNSWPFLISR